MTEKRRVNHTQAWQRHHKRRIPSTLKTKSFLLYIIHFKQANFYLLVNNNIGHEFFLRLRELNEMTHWWSRLTKAWDDNLAIVITSTPNLCTWSGDTAESPLALFSWLAVLFSDRHAAWYSFFACISFVYFFSHGFWAWNVNCGFNFKRTMVYR